MQRTFHAVGTVLQGQHLPQLLHYKLDYLQLLHARH
jgi:hypothetical protein